MIRLALRVQLADAEIVLADLLELAPSGVEELEIPAQDGGEGYVEYAVYGSAGELPRLPDLRAAVGGALVEVTTSEIADDWSERWRQFHRPVLIRAPTMGRGGDGDPGREDAPELVAAMGRRGGSDPERDGAPELVATMGRGTGSDPGRDGAPEPVAASASRVRARVPSLHVRPPWEAPSGRQGVREIVIDPAQAFGTGAHATTRLCLELLLELACADGARGAVLDIGAGSGVLAIAAVELGYRPVLALDNDRDSLSAILDNAAANAIELEVRRFDLRSEALPEVDGMPAPVMLANLLKPLLHSLSATISSPPRHLIASGLLCAEADGVAGEFATRHGLRERRRLEHGEWAALWLSDE